MPNRDLGRAIFPVEVAYAHVNGHFAHTIMGASGHRRVHGASCLAAWRVCTDATHRQRPRSRYMARHRKAYPPEHDALLKSAREQANGSRVLLERSRRAVAETEELVRSAKVIIEESHRLLRQ